MTRASTCSWVVHLVSRLPPLTKRPIQTRFRWDFGPEGLNQAIDGNSPDHYAKGTPSHVSEDNRAPTACKRMVSGSFPPLTGVLFIFRSPYFSLSVIREYLALGDGPPRFSPDSTWPDLLGYLSEVCSLSNTGLSPSMVSLSNEFF